MTGAFRSDETSKRPLETSATVEHVIPQGKGGSNDAWNILLACQRCNGLRGDLPYEIFEKFARVVIRQYPDAPTPILRLALRQFVDSLAEIAIRNRKESNRALSLALLALGERLRKIT